MAFDRRTLKHLAQDSLDRLASPNDLPWSRRSCSDGGATGAMGATLWLADGKEAEDEDDDEAEDDEALCCGHFQFLEAMSRSRVGPRVKGYPLQAGPR